MSGSREMVAALKAVSSPVKSTEYPGGGHDAWTATYANEAVIDWLFTFAKATPPDGGAGNGGAAAGGSAGTTSETSAGASISAGNSSAGSLSNSGGTPSVVAGTSGTMTPTSSDSGCSLPPCP